ncbi:hypothetical protein KY084_01625 [Stakelama sp. CBK3Z-3]|uniref:ABM domain-containing protein n=1 Tax=Stakelama flava TaxID=2860338 RepID=A0ABS6XH87_9SPHN|nr:hypothetical protein [Stakelama flava]MBW4329574.1 hypothetical protein [Stakelama flava]
MFARVISAQMGDEGVDGFVSLAKQQLPGARERPGFSGFLLLVDEATGKALNISLWKTREDMEAVSAGTVEGIHQDGVSEAGIADLRLENYEVVVDVVAAP